MRCAGAQSQTAPALPQRAAPDIHFHGPPQNYPTDGRSAKPSFSLRCSHAMPHCPRGWGGHSSLAGSSEAGAWGGPEAEVGTPGQRGTRISPRGWRSGPESPREAEARPERHEDRNQDFGALDSGDGDTVPRPLRAPRSFCANRSRSCAANFRAPKQARVPDFCAGPQTGARLLALRGRAPPGTRRCRAGGRLQRRAAQPSGGSPVPGLWA